MNRTALISGASRGIGLAVAEGCLEDGFDVALISLAEDRLKRVADDLASRFPHRIVRYQALDVGNADLVTNAVKHLLSQLPPLFLVFNNAGIYHPGSADTSPELFHELLKVNVAGVMNVARATLPALEKSHGYLLNVSSVCGKQGFAGVGAYTASKFAVSGLNESLFNEYAHRGVKVTAICPSWVRSDMSTRSPVLPEDMIQPEDITATVRYLLSLTRNACPKEIVIECLGLPRSD